MSSIGRIKNGIYTDADVLAVYMKYRERGFGPFTREVGDFIAHSKRDRGATLDVTSYVFAQIAFFQTYISDPNQLLEPKGKCGWWLKHYLLTKTKTANEEEIYKAAGLTKKQAKNAIKSWFPDKEVYSTEIKCNDPKTLYALANFFGRVIEGQCVFEPLAAKAELTKIFDAEGIKHSELDRFLLGTATILNGKSVEIFPGFTAKVDLRIGQQRILPVEDKSANTDGDYVAILPDGDLVIGIRTNNNTGDELVNIALDLLDTGLDTEPYFSRSLIEFDEYGIPHLRLTGVLSFDTSHDFPVYELSQSSV